MWYCVIAVSTRHAGQIAAAARGVSRGHSAPERSASRPRPDQHVTRPGNNTPYIYVSPRRRILKTQKTLGVSVLNFEI